MAITVTARTHKGHIDIKTIDTIANVARATRGQRLRHGLLQTLTTSLTRKFHLDTAGARGVITIANGANTAQIRVDGRPMVTLAASGKFTQRLSAKVKRVDIKEV